MVAQGKGFSSDFHERSQVAHPRAVEGDSGRDHGFILGEGQAKTDLSIISQFHAHYMPISL